MNFFPLNPPINTNDVVTINAHLPTSTSKESIPFLHGLLCLEKIISFDDVDETGLVRSVGTSLLDLAELRACLFHFLPQEVAAPILKALPQHELPDTILVKYFFECLPNLKSRAEIPLDEFCQVNQINFSQLPITRLIFIVVKKDNDLLLNNLLAIHPDAFTCFFNKDEDSKTALEYICDVAVAEITFSFLEHNKLGHALLLKNQKNRNLVEHLAYEGSFDVLKILFKHHLETNLVSFDLLTKVRDLYFNHLKMEKRRDADDKICGLIRESLRAQGIEKAIPLLPSQQMPVRSIPQACEDLFGEIRLPPDYSTQANLLKHALYQLYSCLQNPHACFKILRFLNQEFVRYCQVSNIDIFKLDSQIYGFMVIDGLFYPYPYHNYAAPSKGSVLQKFLIAFLRGHGLAARCVQWLGYVPSVFANLNVINGDFVTENRLGEGLFHNKIAHMLHYAILLCMIDAGFIRMQSEKGDVTINIYSILTALVTEFKPGVMPWSIIFDRRNKTNVSFTDPHRLTSCIMYYADKLEVRQMADCMIDTLCKGSQHLHAAFELAAFLTVVDMLSKFNDKHLHLFNNRQLLFTKASEKNKAKQLNAPLNFTGLCSAIYEKNYDINPEYKPRHFK